MKENVKDIYNETMKDSCALADSELDTVSGGNQVVDALKEKILEKYRDDDGQIKSRVEQTIEDLNNQLKGGNVVLNASKVLGE